MDDMEQDFRDFYGIPEKVGSDAKLRRADSRYALKQRDGGTCFFCGAPSTNVYYKPSWYDVKMKGPHGEMVAYRVCQKCLGRCDRRGTMPIEELEKYIAMLENRGSVRGRVGSQNLFVSSEGKIHFNGTIQEFLDGSIEFTLQRNDDVYILTVDSAKIDNGKVYVNLGIGYKKDNSTP